LDIARGWVSANFPGPSITPGGALTRTCDPRELHPWRLCQTRSKTAGASAASTIEQLKIALSRRKQGFESPRERQQNKQLNRKYFCQTRLMPNSCPINVGERLRTIAAVPLIKVGKLAGIAWAPISGSGVRISSGANAIRCLSSALRKPPRIMPHPNPFFPTGGEGGVREGP
jgi:hypothetical protein